MKKKNRKARTCFKAAAYLIIAAGMVCLSYLEFWKEGGSDDMLILGFRVFVPFWTLVMIALGALIDGRGIRIISKLGMERSEVGRVLAADFLSALLLMGASYLIVFVLFYNKYFWFGENCFRHMFDPGFMTFVVLAVYYIAVSLLWNALAVARVRKHCHHCFEELSSQTYTQTSYDDSGTVGQNYQVVGRVCRCVICGLKKEEREHTPVGEEFYDDPSYWS